MKRILLGVATIGLISTFAIGATRAYFSDQATSSGNTFSAGTLDLKLSDTNETDKEDVISSWSGSNMVPGGAPVSGTIQLKNSGTVAGNHLEVAVMSDCTPEDMAEYLEITTLSYGGESVIEQLANVDGNGWIDLDDFEFDDKEGLDDLLLQNLGVNHPFGMAVRLHPDTTDEYQEGSCSSTLTFTLNQDASQ